MSSPEDLSLAAALLEVADERQRQDARWGEQNHPDGTGRPVSRFIAGRRRAETEQAATEGSLTWRHILTEEVAEAFAETDLALLRAELIQVAAVAICWIEAIDRRTATE